MTTNQITYTHVTLSAEDIDILNKAKKIISELDKLGYSDYADDEGAWLPHENICDVIEGIDFITEHTDVEF